MNKENHNNIKKILSSIKNKKDLLEGELALIIQQKFSEYEKETGIGIKDCSIRFNPVYTIGHGNAVKHLVSRVDIVLDLE